MSEPGRRLPRISIVLPVLGMGHRLAATLDGVLAQDYPDLEVLVADGGSSDETRTVLERYDARLAWWVSAPDRGQSHALNRAFAAATGEVFCWLGGDDRLEAGALRLVGAHLAARPQCDVVAGRCRLVCERVGIETDPRVLQPRLDRLQHLSAGNVILQPSCFWRAELHRRVGGLDEQLHYTMDQDLWCRFVRAGARWESVSEVLSTFVMSDTNKTGVGGDAMIDELDELCRRYGGERVPLSFWHRRLRHPGERLRARFPRWWARALTSIPNALALGALAPFYGYRRVRMMNWQAWVPKPRPDDRGAHS